MSVNENGSQTAKLYNKPSFNLEQY